MRFGRLIGMIWAMTGLAACASYPSIDDNLAAMRQASLVTMPVTFTDDGGFMIDVMLNGSGPYPFLIDTGATSSAVFNDTRRSLNLPMIDGRLAQVRGIVDTELRPVASVSSIALGPLEHTHLNMVVLETRRSEATQTAYGLIGLDILSDYIVSYDSELAQLAFLEPGSLADMDLRGWVEIPLQSDVFADDGEALHFSSIRMGERTIPALIDLGSVITMMNWTEVENFWLKRMRQRLEDEWEIQGAVGEFRPRLRGAFEILILGDTYPLQNQQVLIYEFNSVNVTGRPDEPLFIAGADIFRPRDFIIDFPADRLYLQKPSIDPRDAPTGSRIVNGGVGSSNVVTFGTDRQN